MGIHFRECFRRVAGLWLVAISCSALTAGLRCETAHAAIIITVPTISLPYSAVDRTETLEVYVQDANDLSPPEIGADQVELALPNTSSIFFTGAAATTSSPYPYLYGPTQTLPAPRVTNNLIWGSDDGNPPVLANDDGLMLVDFTIKGGTTGDFSLTLNPYNAVSDVAGTGLFNQINAQIPVTFAAGSIDIAAVPEPSSVLLAILAATFGTVVAGARWLRRPRAAAV